MNSVIYLDHNATTPILPEVLEAMMPLKKIDSCQSRAFSIFAMNCKLWTVNFLRAIRPARTSLGRS